MNACLLDQAVDLLSQVWRARRVALVKELDRASRTVYRPQVFDVNSNHQIPTFARAMVASFLVTRLYRPVSPIRTSHHSLRGADTLADEVTLLISMQSSVCSCWCLNSVTAARTLHLVDR